MNPLPSVASLDIETYGALKSLPKQTVFVPQKCLIVDGVPPEEAIITAALTFPTRDPRSTPHSPWTLGMIASLQPGPSIVFDMRKSSDKALLHQHIARLDTLFTMNGAFDLGWLRYCHVLYEILSHQQVHDLAVYNYTYSELRPEKSLKAIGRVRNIYNYEQTARDRFDTIEQCLSYNAEDTHNTILGITTIANDILCDLPEPARSAKLNPDMLLYYSDMIWNCVRKTENGIPLDLDKALHTASIKLDRINAIHHELATSHNLIVSNKGDLTGTKQSKLDFVLTCIEELDTMGIKALSHELFQYTDTGAISAGTNNRNLFRILLPDDHPLQHPLSLWQEYEGLHKEYSSYFWPLIWRKRKKYQGDYNYSSVAQPIHKDLTLPPPPEDEREIGACIRPPLRALGVNTVGTAHPSWFIVPSMIKDGSGAEGGTKQGRPIAKNPAGQTFPPSVQDCIRSRWKGGYIVSYDLSQIEMRVAGILSGDPSLMAAYLRGDDLHTGLAIRCEGPDIVNHPYFHTGIGSLDPRQWYKQANFLILFRGGPLTLQLTILRECNKIITSSFATSIINALKLERAGLWAWQDEMIAAAHRTGRIDLPIIGVSRYFMGGSKFDENEICNFPVQTWAGTLQNEIDNLTEHQIGARSVRHPNIRTFLNVYDSCKYDCRDLGEVERLDTYMANTINHITRHGLYARLRDLTGNDIPLEYSRDLKGPA